MAVGLYFIKPPVIIVSREKMNATKSFIICGIVAAVLFVGSASAGQLTDDTDDVQHWKWHDNIEAFKWVHSVTSKPNLDITEISYTIVGEEITIEMKVQGAIADSEKIWYIVYYNTTDSRYYLSYYNGQGFLWGFTNDYTQFATENVTVIGEDTLSATIDLVGTGVEQEFWGYAAQYTGEPGDESAEWWGDWIPQDVAPVLEENGGNGNGGEDTNDDGGTPGFELAALVMGIAAALLLIKRKK
jgi:hypothetical protein